ncbi:hypothetical protein A2U01_0020669, partial [Trifolium medium]|nr:hypothetical protein [Trifolium medium]
ASALSSLSSMTQSVPLPLIHVNRYPLTALQNPEHSQFGCGSRPFLSSCDRRLFQSHIKPPISFDTILHNDVDR